MASSLLGSSLRRVTHSCSHASSSPLLRWRWARASRAWGGGDRCVILPKCVLLCQQNSEVPLRVFNKHRNPPCAIPLQVPMSSCSHTTPTTCMEWPHSHVPMLQPPWSDPIPMSTCCTHLGVIPFPCPHAAPTLE